MRNNSSEEMNILVESKQRIGGNNGLYFRRRIKRKASLSYGAEKPVSVYTDGKVQMVSRWKIVEGGKPYLVTTILKPVK